jgi:signal transduction histidine kinase
MAQAILNILIVDDDQGDRKQVRRALKQAGLSVECVETASIEEALEACDKCAFDCAIIDYRMPGYDGLRGIAALHERFPYMPIIMATGQGDEMVATEAMKRGASDYVPKNRMQAETIRHIIDSAVEKSKLRRQVAQQREELEKFAFVLAHDLKAPITSIQTFALFIEQDLRVAAADKNAIVSYCREISNAVWRLDGLINTLYEYTKIDAQVPFEPVEMRAVMEDTLSNLEHLIQERSARIAYGALPAVIGNAPQLTQLLQNLIGNGIKYCDARPTIDVTASPDRENIWRLAVKDNGIGISKECYQQIFEPFKRLHGTGKYEGTGLGLATCKKIVERHGGAVWCESEEGRGATFFFTLQGAHSHA